VGEADAAMRELNGARHPEFIGEWNFGFHLDVWR
jgi:hypothetical protein